MSENRGSLLDNLLQFLSSLVGTKPSPQPAPPQPTPPLEPTPILDDAPLTPLAPRVLAIVYDPVIDPNTGLRLSKWAQQNRGWHAVDQLIEGYVGDVAECSGGLVKYRVVERLDVDEWPRKVDGFRYTWESYQQVLQRPDTHHQPDQLDYYRVLNDFNLLARVAAHEIDEVWLFCFPFAGTFESIMVGEEAFWCNAPPLANTRGRRFVIMGFSYERGVGEMLEDLGHRAESLMERVWSRVPDEHNLWKKFVRYDKVAPGQAECGNVHFAPNSDSDYDWGNPRPVLSRADDWLNFPNFKNEVKMMNCSAWGNGDIRLHHKWWMTRFPKAAGRTQGIRNNWWSYIADVTNPEFDER